ACETTCPSGVRYGRLVDIGRSVVESKTRRGPFERAGRAMLAFGLPRTQLFSAALALGRVFRPLLPGSLRQKIPPKADARAWPAPRHKRKMLVLAGCVQPALAPSINAAAARVLDRRDDMRALIDAWWPMVESGEAEAIVMTASGCGVTVKDYGHLLAGDPEYRDKAARISALCRDLSEVVPPVALKGAGKVALQSPCTLQHGQQIRGRVEALLQGAGYQLTPVDDAHLCCGSAGTYALLQPQIAGELRRRKLAALEAGGPQV